MAQQPEEIVIGPNPGPQSDAFASSSTITVYGGQAGGGKSYLTLFRFGVHADRYPGYSAVIFRREMPMVTVGGGLWEESMRLYPIWGARPNSGTFTWRWPSRSMIQFRGLQYANDVLNYQGAQLTEFCLEEATHFCLTPDHDVLTHRGWLPIAEVAVGDYVLSRVGPGAEYRKVLDVPSFDYDGELVRVQQRNGIDLLATPNHRVLVQRQDGDRSLGFVRADHLEQTIQTIPRVAEINRRDRSESVMFDAVSGQGIGANQNSATECDIDTWLEFLGWFLSEGCVSDGRVRIAQTKPALDLDSLMKRIPWRSHADGRGGWVISSRQLATHLNPFGDTYTKRVPRYVADCSPRQVRIFIDAFARGDGHTTKNGSVQIGLANKGLRDDLQELYVIAGRIATSADGVDSTGKFHVYSLSVSKKSRSNTMVKPENVSRESYSGRVWCLAVDCPPLEDFTRGGYERPSVPGGNFLVRRNGRCHFTGNTESQFWYMFSRLRSNCGMRPRCMLTCNPDPDSWVRKLIDWFIGEDGYPIAERAGKKRYFIRDGDTLIWGDTPEEVKAQTPHLSFEPNSLRFIPAGLEDNPRGDPTYEARLNVLPMVERARLRGGNWNIRAVAGSYFKRSYFSVAKHWPGRIKRRVRAWDLAATAPNTDSPDPDWTVGVLMAELDDGRYLIEHVERLRASPGKVDDALERIAAQDGVGTIQAFWQDPAQAGKAQKDHIVTMLRGYRVRFMVAREDKETYAGPVSSDAEHGKFLIKEGPWNEAFLSVLEGFPTARKKDDVDALSRAHREFAGSAIEFDTSYDAGLPTLRM